MGSTCWSLECGKRMNLDDYDARAQALRTEGNALAARAVADAYRHLGGHEHDGGAHDAVPHRLAW